LRDSKRGDKVMYVKELKIGDVFYTSWGYDQTNYDYIVIIDITKSRKTAICQRAELKENIPVGQHWKQKPSNRGYGKPFRMCIKVADWREDKGFYLRGSYPFCSNDDEGKHKRLDSFFKCEDEQVFYETDTQFGH